jgi:hypothetical protein
VALNDVYRRLRYREDDPLRYLHVPRRRRLDVDEDGGVVMPPDDAPLPDIGPDEMSDEIVPEQDLR